MVDFRTAAAAALGVLVGVLCLLAPDAVARTQAIGRRPPGQGGEYGADDTLSERWRWVIRLLGVASLLAGLYFGVVAFS